MGGIDKRSFTAAVLNTRMVRSRIIALALSALLLLPRAALASSDAAAPSKKLTSSRAFLTLDPFMVSVVENYRVRGFLVIEVTLNVPGKDDQDGVLTMQPRLRDAYVRALMEYGAKIASIERVPDLTAITARLQKQTDLVLGSGKARILLTQTLVRPLS